MKPRASISDPSLFVVSKRENFVHWLAWRFWLAREGGKQFFPDELTVPGELPPQTYEAAQTTASWFRSRQRAAKVLERFSDPSEPWDRWSVNETLDIERRHRDDLYWLPPLPKSKIGVLTASEPNELGEWTREQVAEVARKHPGPYPRKGLKAILEMWRDQAKGGIAK